MICCLAAGRKTELEAMLENLYGIFGSDSGQVALTSKQASLISNFTLNKKSSGFQNLLEDRYDLKIPGQYAEKLIKSFEVDNQSKSFTVSKKSKILISPHEYLMAKSIKANVKLFDINFTFVGGCFPVQTNIVFEDLFHQILKRRIEESINVTFNINIIRYERFTACLDKIRDYNKNNAVDILLFSIMYR
jgi:hypothetical protein